MPASTPSALAIERSLAFCWDSWGQMGLSHATEVVDPRAADPEALIVFTLEVARHDPRVFDELLDWLRENERLISVQRLRNLARDDRDRQVVQAALTWVARFRTNPRFAGAPGEVHGEAELLFPASAGAAWGSDPTFLAHGLQRGAAEASFKSRRPDVGLPVNFAFRLRLALGVGSRAEVIRDLLTMPSADASAQQVAQATAFAKRNVAETLDGLVAAGLVTATPVANERRYALDRTAWASLLCLDPGRLPEWRAWPQLLGALRRTLRFLSDPGLDGLSGYMRASAARDLIEEVGRDLLSAGVPLPAANLAGEAYWDGFLDTVDAALDALRT